MVWQKATVDDVVDFILSNAPPGASFTENPFKGTRFTYDIVTRAVGKLHRKKRFLDLNEFDIPGTSYMWRENGVVNYELARKATKQFLVALQEWHPRKTLEQIIPEITERQFYKIPINRYGTTIGGMLQHVYRLSPYNALKDLFDNCAEFAHFRDLQPYDMGCAPKKTWLNKDRTKNYVLARKATRQLLSALKKKYPKKNLTQIITGITAKHFKSTPINKYNATLGCVLKVYDDSPYAALMDLFNFDDAFAHFRDLMSYDMKCAPMSLWLNKDRTKNYQLARKVTRTLLEKLSMNKPLESVLPTITVKHFENLPINKYGTTLGGMLRCVYGRSPYAALKNLIDNDAAFASFRDFQPCDMHHAPAHTWTNADGTKNYTLARQATRQLIARLREEQPHKPVKQISREIRQHHFHNTPINRYGTTLQGMLMHVYRDSPQDAIKDIELK